MKKWAFFTTTLALASFMAGVDGRSCKSCAQTVQQIRTGTADFGSSLRARPVGGVMGGIQVGTRIPYATMNSDGMRPAASVRRYSSGFQTAPNFGGGFGLNPLLRGGAATGPVISQPILPAYPPSAPVSSYSRPQAYNPYTGKVYGNGSGAATSTSNQYSRGYQATSSYRPPPASTTATRNTSLSESKSNKEE
ncbi:MAG: hypothetical protein H6751_17910 [Candidatus Omnitrophica bacterium]|nr:hypothetical protein [Candidatus Omnitrophota bacterium]MCB9770168.1 hypothetical protein [Candidatus Omnitrophota bacterium]MCB9784849.1 hypothetical protein [Candidatus Omnitrophota bacterium]